MLTPDQYAENFTTPLDEIQEHVLTDTEENHDKSHMLSGRIQGQLLRMLVQMIQPRYVLEIGTYTGFSALCMASALPENGELHTLELREDTADMAKKHIGNAGYGHKIQVHVGEADKSIAELNKPWDLVYIDADKPGYIDYYEAVLKTMKPGGIILADNVLFHGDVLSSPPKGKNGKAIHAFNEHVLSDERVENMLMTVRDGLMFIRVK